MTSPLTVLVVEDEPLIQMMIEDFLDLLGYRVAACVDSAAAAIERIEAGGFDLVLLDVNLSDGPCWPVADALAGRGVPFVLATGGHVEPPPAAHAAARQLAKPFTLDGLQAALDGARG